MKEYIYTHEKDSKATVSQDQFTPSEAKDVVKNMIEWQVNFYKLKQLKTWIGNHSESQDEVAEKIEALQKRKDEFVEIIEKARQLNCTVTVDTSVQIKLNK